MKSFLVTALALAVSATAAAQGMRPDAQVKQRKSAYAIINANFGSLHAMANGKKPYNAAEAERNAQFVSLLADYPKGFFGEGTDKGETRARPEIWQKRADFDAKMDRFIAEARKLPAAAQDPAALGKAVAEVERACDACHDSYRSK